jgi:hypothetical protein
MTRFVTTNRTIHTGLASGAPVRYGDKELGPAGALPQTMPRKA